MEMEMEMEFGESSAIGGQNESMELHLGYRFDPHPSELICYYLNPKNHDLPLPREIQIPVVDHYEWHPKRLATEIDSGLGAFGNGRGYYFTKRKRRDQRGSRVNRSTNEGYWKTTSKDKVIKDDKNKTIGYHKTFKFFEGKHKKPTNWLMHEFRDLNTESVMEMDSVMDASTSNENSNRIEHYVLCMIYEKGKKCQTNYPPFTPNYSPSTQAIMNTGVNAIEEVRGSSIPQPHEASMDQFQLPPFGNYNEFPPSQEFLDYVMRTMTEPDPEKMQLDFFNPNRNTMY